MDMSTDASTPAAIDLDRAQFDQPDAATAPRCAFCQRALLGSYFDVNGHAACEACRHRVEQEYARGPGTRAFLKALAAGLGAAIGGFLLYWAIQEFTGYEFGLIAVVVGIAVGRAVRWGSRGRGGWVYQTMAIALTYMAISCSYLPGLFKAWREEHPRPAATASAATSAPVAGAEAQAAAAPPVESADRAAAGPTAKPGPGNLLLGLGALLGLAAALPFLAGAQNILGILILGFGVFEAWKINRRPKLRITGPLALQAPPQAAAP